MSDTTDDGFLGGRLRLLQPRQGYRAGVDPVLLAAAVTARGGESVLDAGCGVGTALFCLGHRVSGLDLVGIERQEALAALARENAARNGLAARIVTADLLELPADLRAQSFDHVITNPPFFDRTRGTRSDQPGKEAGRGEDVPLPEWIDACIRRLAPKGRLTLVQHPARLPDVLSAIGQRLGDMVIQPIAPRAGRAASLVIVTGAKGRKAPPRLAFPMVLHDGATHERDGDDYAPLARAVLREGAALPLGD